MTFTQPAVLRPATPASITAIRVLIALQIVAGVAVGALVALVGMLILSMPGSNEPGETTRLVIGGLLALGVLAVPIITLARCARRLHHGSASARRTLLVCEALLFSGPALLIAWAAFGSAGSLGDLGPAVFVLAGLPLAVAALLSAPSTRAWTL